MAVNGKPAGGVRLEAHWRLVSWSLLDKGLPLVFGIAFVLLVVRTLPPEEFGMQALAAAMVLTASQLLRSLFLVPTIKFVAETPSPGRIAATGTLLYVAASGLAALGLAAFPGGWSRLFDKPGLAAVLLPSACLLGAGSARDAALAVLEGRRALRRLFVLDAIYYVIAIGLLAWWRASPMPRTAVAIQWMQAGAAAVGSLLALAATRDVLAARPSRAEGGRLVRFGGFAFGSGLGETLRQQADVLLAGRLLDASGVAAYGTAKLFFRGFNQLAQSIVQILMPLVSRLQAAQRTDDLRVLYEKSVCFLALALVPICAVLWLFTEPLLRLFVGERGADSVPVLRWLVVSALALPGASVGSPFLLGMGRVRTLFVITWSGLLVWFLGALVGLHHHGAAGGAAAVCVAAMFGLAARTWVLQRALGFRLRDVAGRWRDAREAIRRRLDQGLMRRRTRG